MGHSNIARGLSWQCPILECRVECQNFRHAADMSPNMSLTWPKYILVRVLIEPSFVTEMSVADHIGDMMLSV
jgi:hypothetical protein